MGCHVCGYSHRGSVLCCALGFLSGFVLLHLQPLEQMQFYILWRGIMSGFMLLFLQLLTQMQHFVAPSFYELGRIRLC
eukprot:COSAG02_NODE_3559_length_6563_cov_4.152382_8_plen_78_part_00